MRTVKIGLLGFGVVGQGMYRTLLMNRDAIAAKTGTQLVVVRILVRDVPLAVENGAAEELLTTDVTDILSDSTIDIVVEVLGGIEPASTWMLAAMAAGKHVVTANKAAVAANYTSLVEASTNHRVMLRYEAAVAGGIPIMDALQAPLNSNQLEQIEGIVNGTTNFILTQMSENDLSYEKALALAQEKGFAEADPTADVAGTDAANKLVILMATAFGKPVAVADVPTVGVSEVTAEDFRVAEELGYTIKLIASAKKSGNEIQYSVQPTLVPASELLASVANEFNAVLVRGNAVGDLLFYGKGAGGLPTASAVAGDIIEIANAIPKHAAYDTYINQIRDVKLTFIGEGVNRYLVVLEVLDQPGVLSKVTAVLGSKTISVASLVQKPDGRGGAKLFFVLHETAREVLNSALDEMLEKGVAERVSRVMRVLK